MFENKNILFVYSGLGNNLKVQQSFVFIKSLIDEIKESCNSISILTTTDEMQLLIFDDNIKIYQNAVNEKNIMDIIDEKKIDVFVPICGCEQTDKIINRIYQKLKEKKVQLFQEDYFLHNKSKTFVQSIAKKSGFNIYKKIVYQNREKCKEFFATCIKDYFGNQIIFDICDYSSINEKPFFLSPSVLLNNDNKEEVLRLIREFGNNLQITNVPYTIHFNIDADGKIYFDSIYYGYCYEAIFLFSAKNIDISKIIINISNLLPVHYQASFTYFAEAYNYEHFNTITFSDNFSSLHPNISAESVYKYTNSCLFHRLCLLKNYNENVSHITSLTNHNIYDNKRGIENNVNECKTNKEHIIVYLDGIFFDDLGNLIVFLELCKRLKQQTKKDLVLVARQYISLLSIVDFSYIFVFDSIQKDDICSILSNFNIKNAMLCSIDNNSEIIKILKEQKVKIYGLNYKDDFLYANGTKKYNLSSCKQFGDLDYLYNNEYLIYDFYCIKDSHKNEYNYLLFSNIFSNETKTKCLLYPCIEANFDFNECLIKIVDEILSKIYSCGIIHMRFYYYNGDIFIKDIKLEISNKVLYLFNFSIKNNIYDILLNALIGKNIDLEIRQSKIISLPKFYSKILFDINEKHTLTIDGDTHNKIYARYNCITKNT